MLVCLDAACAHMELDDTMEATSTSMRQKDSARNEHLIPLGFGRTSGV